MKFLRKYSQKHYFLYKNNRWKIDNIWKLRQHSYVPERDALCFALPSTCISAKMEGGSGRLWVSKCEDFKNLISEIMEFVRIFWKNNVQAAYLRKATTSCKSTWDTVPYFGINGLSMILCLWSPLHPLSKLLAIQDHTQNVEEQLWIGGRREVSIICYRLVTRSDLKQERSFFRGSVSSFLQLVVALCSKLSLWGRIRVSPVLFWDSIQFLLNLNWV